MKRERCLDAQESVITVPLLYLITPVESKSLFRDPVALDALNNRISRVNSCVSKVLEGPFSFLNQIMYLVMTLMFDEKKEFLQDISSGRDCS